MLASASEPIKDASSCVFFFYDFIGAADFPFFFPSVSVEENEEDGFLSFEKKNKNKITAAALWVEAVDLFFSRGREMKRVRDRRHGTFARSEL